MTRRSAPRARRLAPSWPGYRPKSLFAAIVSALLLVGCGGGGGAPTQGQSPTEATEAGNEAGGLTVRMTDFLFDPSKVRVPKGATITVRNAAPRTPHSFTVKGQAIDVVGEPQQSNQITVNLAPGEYPFVCRFHESRGMKGTLIVT